jgi:hypothetical protein
MALKIEIVRRGKMKKGMAKVWIGSKISDIHVTVLQAPVSSQRWSV